MRNLRLRFASVMLSAPVNVFEERETWPYNAWLPITGYLLFAAKDLPFDWRIPDWS
jgi:hypothetical protein